MSFIARKRSHSTDHRSEIGNPIAWLHHIMERLHVIMLVLGVLVGLMLIGIGVMLVMRQRKKKTSKDPNSVTLIQRGGGAEKSKRSRPSSRASRASSRASPQSHNRNAQQSSPRRYMSPQSHAATARSLGSLMGKDDQEKMEALLQMRNMCDDNSVGSSSPYRSKPAAVNHNRGGRPPSRLGGPVPLSSPVRLGGPVAPTSQLRKNRTPTSRMRMSGIFGGLDNDEEDTLLVELDQTMPAPSIHDRGFDRDAGRGAGYMAFGVDRDAGRQPSLERGRDAGSGRHSSLGYGPGMDRDAGRHPGQQPMLLGTGRPTPKRPQSYGGRSSPADSMVSSYGFNGGGDAAPSIRGFEDDSDSSDSSVEPRTLV